MKKLANNKKGFSLIELIIVIAIMVALIAVMAPNFVKYVQKSRDTALSTAAEDFYSAVKVFYGDPDCEFQVPADATIKVEVTDGKLVITPEGLSSTAGQVSGKTEIQSLYEASGVDTDKSMGNTKDVYTIAISAGPSFKMTKTTK